MSNESDAVRPPDMVGAGIMPPGQPPVDLMGALSMGTMPTGAMQQMMQPQQGGMGGLGGAISAMGAGVFAGRGQADLVARQQLQQQHQQMQQMHMMQQMQERQQDRAAKRLESSSIVLQSMLFGPHAIEDSETRASLAKQYKSLTEQTTPLKIPESVVTVWAKGGPSQDSNKEIATYLAAADAEQDPRIRGILEQKAQQYFQAHGGKQEEWQATGQLLRNPAFATKFGLPDPQTRLTKHYEMETKAIAAWTAQHPEWSDTGKLKGLSSWGNQWTQKYGGQRIYDLDPKNPDDRVKLDAARAFATAMATKELQTTEEQSLEKLTKEQKIKQDAIKERELAVAREKPAKPAPTMSFAAEARELDKFLPLITGAAEISTLRTQWLEADRKGLLPSKTGPGAAWGSKLSQWWNTNDPSLVALRAFIAPVSIGIIDRNLNDEKASRAMKMFEEQVKIVRESPTKEGFERLFGLYEYLLGQAAMHRLSYIQRNRGGKVSDAMADEAEERVKSAFPNGFPADPTAAPQAGPLTDPKTLYNSLRKQGKTPVEAREELNRRGYATQ